MTGSFTLEEIWEALRTTEPSSALETDLLQLAVARLVASGSLSLPHSTTQLALKPALPFNDIIKSSLHQNRCHRFEWHRHR